MGTSEGLMDEHFVPVEGYPAYEVSNYGRVIRARSGDDVRIFADHHGHKCVRLYDGVMTYVASLRRLVAQAFFVDFKPSSDVYLISQNKNDCSVRNITLQQPDIKREPLHKIETRG